MSRKIIIIGGSLSGAAAAARIRSLDSQAEIILLEKGASIAYAGTAWPGMLADDTATPRDRQTLTADEFQSQYRIDVRCNSEVTAIHRLRRLVDIRPASDQNGKIYRERYDYLILATGCTPVRPAAFAESGDGVFALKSPADILQIRTWLKRPSVQNAVIIGGTPTGLQAAEALISRGVGVTLVEKANHVMAAMDPDLARVIERYLRQIGIQLKLSRQVIRVSRQDGHLFVQFNDQSSMPTDLVIMACGNKPDNALAVKSGLKTGPFDCIPVTNGGQTVDKRIFAVGALVSSSDLITGKSVWRPSAPAVVRQARQTAEYLCNRHAVSQSMLNLAHLTLKNLEAGIAGAGESDLLAMQAAYSRTYSIIPGDDGQTFHIVKVLWSRQNRRLLGAQLVSSEPAADKLAVLALAIQARQTVEDLARYEMPGDALQPGRRHWLSQIGQQAQNLLDGLSRDFSIYDLASLDTSRVILVDVRPKEAFLRGTIPAAISLPLADLIAGLHAGRQDLLPDKPVYLFSETGRQGYLAARALMQAGRPEVYNLAGGYWLYAKVIG